MTNLYTQNCPFNKNILAQYFVAGTQDVPANSFLTPQQRLLSVLGQALKKGITCFQLREKGNNALKNKKDIKQLALACKALCHKHGIPFFINDDVTLALEVKADGIHVGQDDMAITKVINKCRDNLWIGLSINTLVQAQTAETIEGIDYYGVGAIFPTQSKADAKNVGLQLITDIRNHNITKPIVGIGGIDYDNSKQVINAGANGVAMISAIVKDIYNSK